MKQFVHRHLQQQTTFAQFIHFSAKAGYSTEPKTDSSSRYEEERQNKESRNPPHPLFGTPEIGQRQISSYQRSPGKPERLEGKEEREEVEG